MFQTHLHVVLTPTAAIADGGPCAWIGATTAWAALPAADAALWIVFGCVVVTLLYIYAGYPLLIAVLARCRRSQVIADPVAPPTTCSVIVASYNDAAQLERKFASLAQLDGQETIVEVILASDGSTDATAEFAESIEGIRFRFVEFPTRRGKAAVLNDIIPECLGEIVILTDARQELDPAAVTRLLDRFRDGRIGVVSGELHFRSAGGDSSATEGIGAYWKYEKFIRRNEALVSSVPGATGALYAIRRNLFKPVHPNSVLDDVAIPMQIVAQGYRCVFEDRAILWDVPSASAGRESVRKRRTIAGNLQLVMHAPWLLLPWKNPIWLQFVSHKLARLASPLLLFVAFVANALLADTMIGAMLLATQLAFYGLAIVGWKLQPTGIVRRMTAVPFMFVALNVTTLLAIGDFFRGRCQAVWDRSDKVAETIQEPAATPSAAQTRSGARQWNS